MIAEAAKNGKATDTPSLIKGMTKMTFTGVGGTFTLDENGDPEKSVAINTFEGGKVKWLMTLSPEGTKKIVLKRQSGDVHESMKMSLVHIFHLKEKGNGL